MLSLIILKSVAYLLKSGLKIYVTINKYDIDVIFVSQFINNYDLFENNL